MFKYVICEMILNGDVIVVLGFNVVLYNDYKDTDAVEIVVTLRLFHT